MAKQLQCYHPECGDQIIPPFVAFGTASADVGPLYCGLFRGTEWVQGTELHDPANPTRWMFEFVDVPTGNGWSLWIGELSDSLPMLQLYPLSFYVPTAAGQLIVKYPPQNRIIPVNHIISYGSSTTLVNMNVLDVGGVVTNGTLLKNEAGRWVAKFMASATGIVNATLRFRNTDTPTPSLANRTIRLREVNL